MKKIKRIILFRFHKNFAVCENHLKIIRKFNPKIKIYGLYGGDDKNYLRAKKIGIKNVYKIPMADRIWKWKNGDFCIRLWYKEIGKKIKFDMLHLVEWDLILLDAIDNLFAGITDGVAITNRIPLKKVYNSWDWVAGKRGRQEWLSLKKYGQIKFNYRREPYAGIFGGACLSKKFLDKYAKIEIPGLCNDEVRVPLFAQCFKMNVYDTGLKNKYFSANDKLISSLTVYRKYEQGIKSFHPVRGKLNLKKLIKLKI